MSELTLAAFVEARLADDEAWAAIGAAYLREVDEGMARHSGASFALTPMHEPGGPFDPARVLLEVAAKRAILALHQPTPVSDRERSLEFGANNGVPYWYCSVCDEDRDYGHTWNKEEGCDTLRALASVWRDHPDFDERWTTQ